MFKTWLIFVFAIFTVTANNITTPQSLNETSPTTNITQPLPQQNGSTPIPPVQSNESVPVPTFQNEPSISVPSSQSNGSVPSISVPSSQSNGSVPSIQTNGSVPSSNSTTSQLHTQWLFPGSCGTVYESRIDGNVVTDLRVNSQIIFIITEKYSLYRTSDGGYTWWDQSVYLQDYNATVPVRLREGWKGILDIRTSVNPQWIYIIGPNGKFWTSKDGGETYSYLPVGWEMIDIVVHPNMDGWLIAFHENIENQNRCYLYGYCIWDISFSDDGGQTWRVIIDDIYPGLGEYFEPIVSWGPAGLPGHNNTELFVVKWTEDPRYPLSPDVNYLWHTNDLFSTYSFLEYEVFSLYYDPISQNFYFISTENGYSFDLFVSDCNFTNIKRAVFPTSSATSYDAIILLDITEGSVFAAVHTIGDPEDRLELFSSDTVGSNFSLSLAEIQVSINGYIDYYKVLGLQGIYIANSYLDETTKYSQSVITYNIGGQWSPIKAPSDDSCVNCTLQFLESTTYNSDLSIYSSSMAKGILIANANVGLSTTTDTTTANLFISSDAGKSWRRLLSGPRIFTSSKTADLIVVAAYNGTTKNIQYTYNQGVNWTGCDYYPSGTVEHTIEVLNNNVIGPQSVLIQTSWTDSSTGDSGYSLFFMNFSIPNLPLCGPNDYELFNPSGLLDSCVLGQNITYTRKKADSICQVDPSYINSSQVTYCECARSDYYCTYCFVSDNNSPGSPCVRDMKDTHCASLYDPTPPPAICPNGTFYSASPAYRKVMGSLCIGDVELYIANRTVLCPNTNNLNGNTASNDVGGYIALGVIVGLIIVTLLIFAVVKFYKQWRSNQKFTTLGETEL